MHYAPTRSKTASVQKPKNLVDLAAFTLTPSTWQMADSCLTCVRKIGYLPPKSPFLTPSALRTAVGVSKSYSVLDLSTKVEYQPPASRRINSTRPSVTGISISAS